MQVCQITTQLGGKFSSEDNGLFELKKKISQAGIKITYPEGMGIVKIVNGIGLTFDPNKTNKTFYEIEIDYFKSMKSSNIHIIYNKFKKELGYIGESASIELAYALSHNKPVILLYQPIFSDSVPLQIKLILEAYFSKLFVLRLDKMTTEKLKRSITTITKNFKGYELSVLNELTILEQVNNLLNKYKLTNI